MVESSPSQAQALRTIEQTVTGGLPPGWTLGTTRVPSDRRVDALWTLQAPGGEIAVFAVEFKRKLLGRQVDDVLNQLAGTEGRPVVAASYLSPTLRSTLVGRGVSYADATGNVRLVSDLPGLFVERQGAMRDPWPADSSLQSLRGRGASRAVRALVDFRPPYGLRDLATRAAVSLATLSRTLDLFDREGLVSRGGRGDVIGLDWDRAIRRWAQDYDWARSNRVSYFLDPRGLAIAERKLVEADWRYAVTGASAAQHFAPIAPARQLAVYVEDPGEAAERLRLRPAESGANVVLAEPFDNVVFERTTTREGLRFVAAAQLAVDLLTGPGREPSEGEELLGWMKANEELWRA